jgi:hypothetical protein
MWFFIYSAVLLLIAWLGCAVIYSFRYGGFKFFGFKFSRKFYYLGLMIFPLAAALDAFSFSDLNRFLDFVIFMFAGVVGEVIFSYWWRLFFSKNIWDYSFDTLFGNFTSLLNFIPWGVGGKLFIVLWAGYTKIFHIRLDLSQYLVFWLIFLSLWLVQVILELVLKLRAQSLVQLKDQRINKVYFYFILPVSVTLVLISFAYGLAFLLQALIFGISAFAAEYLFGKFMQLLLSKQLWHYNYRTVDGTRASLFSIVPFSLGGIYFLSIWLILTFL